MPSMRTPRVSARVAVAFAVFGSVAAGCSSSHPQSAGPKTAPAESAKGDVVVFAAASLKQAFTALAGEFEQAHPGVKVVPSFGGSDSLAAQIVQGAPVDVFAAANATTMGTVTKAGDADKPVEFAKNQLEIAVASGNPHHITALADVTKPSLKLALCAPAVPCGAAADKALRAAGITAHPVTLEQDVAAVLTKVELGEVDAGLVYRTDVKTAAGEVDGVDFPEAAQALNTYPIAVVKNGRNAEAGRLFVQFVLSPDGQRVLQAAGFQSAGGS
jgi:molybdate transport system substrate-binding protein